MKYESYNHAELEPEIIKFWNEKKIVNFLRKKNIDGKKFYFLDGPPYTSGKFHLAHAWNYALKDIFLRYKRSRGFNVWDRNGFDVHGLPTEHKVMEKFGLDTKEDIQKFGVDKFITECQKFCLEMADVMTQDLKRMGVSFDLSNPYMALKTEFMEGEWDLIKKAHEKKLLYYGEKVLTWCQHCETAVAKHECEYQNVNDKSIFVKLKVKDKVDEYLIIWTTTPWTIPFNLAVMAGPDIDYVKVEINNDKDNGKTERWILAKDLAEVVVGSVMNKKMKVLEEFKGQAMEGIEYEHPFFNMIKKYAELKKAHPNVHTVILSKEHVDTSAGSGLVHSAPGCGPEDQEACKPYDIPPFNALGEDGYFSKEMGDFSGLRAKVEDKKFIDALEKKGALMALTNVEHEYPHCWRCKNPVVFRITYQWFLKTEDIKQKILDGNKKIHWVPDTCNNSYESWISNLKDNSISRQRYWGTPIPIWKCPECEEIKVISSREEIEDLGGNVPDNLHIPWIDEVILNCSGKGNKKCPGKMKRVPDVIDVWVDAGTVSWNCLDNDPVKIKKLFPADLIMEAKEQTRLWFSLLSICSYIYLGENAFKNVYTHGMLNDLEGKKMSKSIGNIISPYELIDKHGVDVLRDYMCQNNAGQEINFSWDECKVKERQLHILWNVHKLLINLAKENDVNPFKIKVKNFGFEERYILSRLNSTIQRVTELMDLYRVDEAIAPIEELFLDISRTYIQMVRDKSSVGSKSEKEIVMHTIGEVLLGCLKMFQIISPFISEAIYQNLKEEFDLEEESITHFSWPKVNVKSIDKELEQDLNISQLIITAGAYTREKAKLGLRWPVKELVVVSDKKEVKDSVKNLKEIIENQLNIKKMIVKNSFEGIQYSVKPNQSTIGKTYGKLSKEIIKRISTIPAEDLVAKMEAGDYIISVGKDKIAITKNLVNVERQPPAGYEMAEFKQGYVLLSTERTAKLDAEGFSREVMRHVQQLRKNEGLEKLDRIKLFLESPLKLDEFKEDIAEKVGASSIEFKSHSGSTEFKVKDQTFKVWFEKVNSQRQK